LFISRRLRGTSVSRGRKTQPCNCQGRIIGLSLAAVLLLCWLVTVTWLAVVLHGEMRRLNNYVHSGKQRKYPSLCLYSMIITYIRMFLRGERRTSPSAVCHMKFQGEVKRIFIPMRTTSLASTVVILLT